MDSLLAYSSSSDEESDDTTSDDTTSHGENLKKRKVTTDEIEQGRDVCGERNIAQPGDKRMKPFLEPTNATGFIRNSYSESKQTTIETSPTLYKSSRYDGHNDVSYRCGKSQLPACFINQEKKNPAFVSSVTRCKYPNSSSNSGVGVKPYISKREREQFAQPTVPCISPSPVKPLLKENDSEHTVKEIDSEPNNEISGRKNVDRVCRPAKQLHLNLEGHSKGVNSVQWNPTRSNLLLSAAMDYMVCVWDTTGGGTCSRRLTQHTAAVKDSKWSLCGSQVLSCGYDKTARLFDLETGQEIIKFPHKNYVTCVQFHPTDPALFLAGTFKSAILCWDTRTGNITSTYSAFFGQVQDITFLPGGDEFISAAEVIKRNSTDKGIMVWDFRSTAVLSNQIYQEAFTCSCLKVHPHESHFVAQSHGDYIALFSTRKPYKLNKYKRYEGHKVSGYHIGCDFSPDGSIVCSGSADGQIYFYDHHTSRLVRKLQAHSMPCIDVAYHPTLPHCVASCGWDGQVKVWN